MPVGPHSAPDALVAQLIRASSTVGEHYHSSAAAVGLTVQEAQLLFILSVQPRNMLGLTSALRIPKSTMTGLMARMEMAGLVVRDRAEGDRRHLLATPTARGTALARQFERDLAARVSGALAGLDGPEQHELAALLSEVLAGIEPSVARPR